MAHAGSTVATSRNPFSAASYENECKSATARSKSCETLSAQDVANVTVPSRSGGGCECISAVSAILANTDTLSASAKTKCLLSFRASKTAPDWKEYMSSVSPAPMHPGLSPVVSEPAANGLRTILETHRVGSNACFDVAGAGGRTVWR